MFSTHSSNEIKQLDRFEIIEELGRGSQGVVYLARDPQLERNVAIKTFHDSTDFKSAKQALLKEARNVSKLQHVNILTLYETIETDGKLYLVFEYIDGAPLKKYISYKGKLSTEDALEIMIAVLDAIQYAHEHGIIHRDLTPSNIILTSSNKPKIMDFGIADVIGRRDDDNTIRGSLQYLSPEQCENKPAAPQSDIFSLGLILLELLTGKPALELDNQFTLINKIVNEDIKVPESIIPAIKEIIEKAVNRNINERFYSADEMRQALQSHLDEIRPAINEATTDDKDSTLQFLLRRMRHKKDFPVMPQQISEIASSTNDRSDSSANMLANKILRNYSLSTKLLRLVNSPAYGQYGGRISTVSRAVVILGFKEVRMAAMGLMLFDHLQNQQQSKNIKESSLNSMMSGSLARELAPELNAEDSEESYICSMFHQFGKLLTMFYFPEEANIIDSLISRKKVSEQTASTEILGINYQELGIGVARAWHLPVSIVHSMKKIESSEVPAAITENDKNIQLANFSNELCNIMQYKSPETFDSNVKDLLSRFSNSIDLTPKQLNGFISRSVEHVRDYANIFNLSVKDSSFIKNMEGWISDKPADTEQVATAPEDRIVANSNETGKRSVELLNSVQEISDSILDGASLNDVMIMVIETLYSGFDFNHVLFCMINRKNACVDARFGFGPDIDRLLKSFKVPIRREADVFNLALTKQQDYVIDNIDDADISKFIPDWYREKMPARSFVIYPIIVNKVPMGFIYGDKNTQSQLSRHEHISLIKTLCNQIVFAIKQNNQ